MWKMALVAATRSKQDLDVYIYNATGVQRRDYKNYDQAVSELLKEGWEPFSVTWEGSQIFFRMKVS